MAKQSKTQIAQAVEQAVDNTAVETITGKPGAQDVEYVQNPDTGEWSILKIAKDGTKTVRDGGIPAVHRMDDKESIAALLELASKASTKREACLSLLARIVEHQLSFIDGWRGKGKPTEALDKELKGEFQRCEDRFFQQYMDPKHSDHKFFIGRLPKLDARGKALEVDGKLLPPKQFDAFMTNTRREPSYANAKNLVLSLFSLVGKLPYDDKGDIIPPEVMSVMVQKAKIIIPPDNSFRAKLAILWRTMVNGSDEAEAPKDDDLKAIEAMLTSMLEAVKPMRDAAAIRATAAHATNGVAALSDEAIRKAQESTGLLTKEPKNKEPAKT